MIELSEEQRKIVESPEKKIVVVSSAGSGKSRIILERTRWILRQGGDPEKMVVITFTVNAADELKMRLGADYKNGLFIGTIHGYANMLLNRWGVSTADAIDSEDFDHFFTLIKQNPDAIKEIGFLALDEAQDSNFKQFDFIFKMLNPKNFIAVGDFRQSIYGFAGCDPNLLINLGKKSDVVTYDLRYNYRSKNEIVKYSNWIVSLMEEVPNIPTLSFQSGYGLVETIYGDQYIDLILEDGYYKDWAILCRTNNRVYNIIRNLKDYNIPAITFRQAQNSLVDLEEKMNSNSVKVLTIHSAKGLQFPKVVVADQMWKTEEDKRLMYTAATRAENELYWLKRDRRYY